MHSNIENDAFNTFAFHELWSLTLTNLAVTTLGPHTFKGLNKLIVLELRSSRIIYFPSILPPVASSLTLVHISGNDILRSSTQSINTISFGTPMTKLVDAKFHLNLMDSLNGHTFISFVSILFLDLSNCRIQYLDADTFLPISNTLQYLDLSGNNLKSMPLGMLTYLLNNNVLKLYFLNNPWICDCHLSDLQRGLVHFADNFIGDMLCQEPVDFAKMPIKNSHFCGHPAGLSDKYTAKSLICRTLQISYQVVAMKIIKKRSKTFTIHRHVDDSFVLKIWSEYIPTKNLYILDGVNHLYGMRKFFVLPIQDSSSVKIVSWMKQTTVQMICVQGLNAWTTDCATILSPTTRELSMFQQHIGGIILSVALLLFLLLGGFVGYVLAKKIEFLNIIWINDATT